MNQVRKVLGTWWQGLPLCRGGRWWGIWEGQVRVGVGTEGSWPRGGVGEVGREKAQQLALKSSRGFCLSKRMPGAGQDARLLPIVASCSCFWEVGC